jgi:hypothetical protein
MLASSPASCLTPSDTTAMLWSNALNPSCPTERLTLHRSAQNNQAQTGHRTYVMIFRARGFGDSFDPGRCRWVGLFQPFGLTNGCMHAWWYYGKKSGLILRLITDPHPVRAAAITTHRRRTLCPASTPFTRGSDPFSTGQRAGVGQDGSGRPTGSSALRSKENGIHDRRARARRLCRFLRRRRRPDCIRSGPIATAIPNPRCHGSQRAVHHQG